MSVLRCQREPYLRQMTTTILGIIPINDAGLVDVILEDTILYPEGGGQPSDLGDIDGEPVLSLRKDPQGRVCHRLARPPARETVTVTVDWPRRFDHMQQHSAQHLISALAADRFSAETMAFHLRPDVCDIELSRELSVAEMGALEAEVNAEIRAARPIRARLVSAAELDNVRTRGLPENFSGPIRLIEIEGVDLNTCGGTHVNSTAALQSVVLLPPQKHRLRYLAGGRVHTAVRRGAARDQALSQMLSCGVDEHRDAIERLKQSAKQTRSALREAQQELSAFLGVALAEASSPLLHRPGADMNVLRAIATAATARAPLRVFLLLGDGVFMLAGPDATVADRGPRIAAALGGRGGGRGGRFQGRMTRIDTRESLESLLENDKPLSETPE